MKVIVPYSPRDPKTRLAPVLGPTERQGLARHLLDDVLSVLETAPVDPVVVSPVSVDVDVPIQIDDRSLSPAVNAFLSSETGPIAVIMADLGLLTTSAFDRLLFPESDVVLAPGRGGGTNALVVDHPDFFVDFHEGSYRDHLNIADKVDASVRTVDSYRLSTDIDEPVDLAELLLHGTGASPGYLAELGFKLDLSSSRADVTRSGSPIVSDQ